MLEKREDIDPGARKSYISKIYFDWFNIVIIGWVMKWGLTKAKQISIVFIFITFKRQQMIFCLLAHVM